MVWVGYYGNMNFSCTIIKFFLYHIIGKLLLFINEFLLLSHDIVYWLSDDHMILNKQGAKIRILITDNDPSLDIYINGKYEIIIKYYSV